VQILNLKKNNEVDSILILSFGGPEKQEDVMPFLRNVVSGRNVPDSRLEKVAEQYYLFNGVSPINDQCRLLKNRLELELEKNAINLPVYWGNRNWDPMLADTVKQMDSDGKKHALVFVTSAFSSYSGCRQYRQDLELSLENSKADIYLQKLRLYFNHPGFIDTWVDNINEVLKTAPKDSKLIFTAHSIPESMAVNCDYVKQLHDAAKLITEKTLGENSDYDLAFQSRSGPPHIPWLEPDINQHLEKLAGEQVKSVVVVPLGFTSDHMEVLFDLDTQAKQTAEDLDIRFHRVATVGVSDKFLQTIVDLINEQLKDEEPKSVGQLGPWPDECPDQHCLSDKVPK